MTRIPEVIRFAVSRPERHAECVSTVSIYPLAVAGLTEGTQMLDENRGWAWRTRIVERGTLLRPVVSFFQ